MRAAIERLVDEAGLTTVFLDPGSLTSEALQGAPMAYFRMGMACPFLVEESFGVYEERPLACREYLVTSPPAHCAAPDERVEVLRLPLKASEALARLEGTGQRYVKQIPLGLSLKCAARMKRRGRSGRRLRLLRSSWCTWSARGPANGRWKAR